MFGSEIMIFFVQLHLPIFPGILFSMHLQLSKLWNSSFCEAAVSGASQFELRISFRGRVSQAEGVQIVLGIPPSQKAHILKNLQKGSWPYPEKRGFNPEVLETRIVGSFSLFHGAIWVYHKEPGRSSNACFGGLSL